MAISHLVVQLLAWGCPPLVPLITFFVVYTAMVPESWKAQLDSKRWQQLHCNECKGKASLYHAYQEHAHNMQYARLEDEERKQLGRPFLFDLFKPKEEKKKAESVDEVAAKLYAEAIKQAKEKKKERAVEDENRVRADIFHAAAKEAEKALPPKEEKKPGWADHAKAFVKDYGGPLVGLAGLAAGKLF